MVFSRLLAYFSCIPTESRALTTLFPGFGWRKICDFLIRLSFPSQNVDQDSSLLINDIINKLLDDDPSSDTSPSSLLHGLSTTDSSSYYDTSPPPTGEILRQSETELPNEQQLSYVLELLQAQQIKVNLDAILKCSSESGESLKEGAAPCGAYGAPTGDLTGLSSQQSQYNYNTYDSKLVKHA